MTKKTNDIVGEALRQGIVGQERPGQHQPTHKYPLVPRERVLDLAKEAVIARAEHYGRPEDNFARIAMAWSEYRDEPFAPLDVVNMMILMKISRLQNDPTHLDSWVDIAGYAACGASMMCKDPV